MGPHFVGPIIRSLRSLQKKKVNCADQNLDFVKLVKPRLIARPWSSNYGQNQCNLCQNMRQDVAFEVEPSELTEQNNRAGGATAKKTSENSSKISATCPSTLPSSPKIG